MKLSKNLFSFLTLCFLVTLFSIDTAFAQEKGSLSNADVEYDTPTTYSKIKNQVKSGKITDLEILPGNQVRPIQPTATSDKRPTSRKSIRPEKNPCNKIKCPPSVDKRVNCWDCGNGKSAPTKSTKVESIPRPGDNIRSNDSGRGQ